MIKQMIKNWIYNHFWVCLTSPDGNSERTLLFRWNTKEHKWINLEISWGKNHKIDKILYPLIDYSW